MQIFTCPFCGDRDETEFYFAGEAGNDRPQPAENVSAEEWANYLYFLENPKGDSQEIWIHLTCNEAFIQERNTLTHEVTGCRALPHWQTRKQSK